jgi:hypothetical protein
MFRHVVVFRWTEQTTDAQKKALSDGLAKLPAEIDAIRAYRFGPDAGMGSGNYDFAVVADFDDSAGYVTYRDHPAHQAVVKDLVAPILAERAAVQYELGD